MNWGTKPNRIVRGRLFASRSTLMNLTSNNTPEQVGTQENDYADQVAERGLANETIDIITPNIVRRISKAISLIAEEYMMQSELLTRAQLTERGGQLCAVSVMS